MLHLFSVEDDLPGPNSILPPGRTVAWIMEKVLPIRKVLNFKPFICAPRRTS